MSTSEEELRGNLNRRVSSVSLRRLSTGFTHFIRRRSSFFSTKVFNKKAHRSNVSILPIEEVRESVLSAIDADDTLRTSISPMDIERVKSNNWFIERFVLDHSEDIFCEENDIIDESTRAIIACLVWREKQAVNKVTSLNFPREFYSCGLISHVTSPNSESIVLIRGKFFKKSLHAWSTLLKQFITHYYEMMDAKLPGADSAVIIIDLINCHLRQFDINYVYFIIDLIDKYYPHSCTKIHLTNASWFIKPGLAFTLSFASFKYQSMVSFTGCAQLKNIFGCQCLPPFLGGTAPLHLVIPLHVATVEQIALAHSIDVQSTDELRRVFT